MAKKNNTLLWAALGVAGVAGAYWWFGKDKAQAQGGQAYVPPGQPTDPDCHDSGRIWIALLQANGTILNRIQPVGTTFDAAQATAAAFVNEGYAGAVMLGILINAEGIVCGKWVLGGSGDTAAVTAAGSATDPVPYVTRQPDGTFASASAG